MIPRKINDWRSKIYRRNVKRLCCFCEKDIANGEKHDVLYWHYQNGVVKPARFAHITCGLRPLDKCIVGTPQLWIGLRVLHPMEQWAGVPNWEEKPDQGVVVDFEKQENGRIDVWFLPDGQDLRRDGREMQYLLGYNAGNLWVRE